MKKKLVLLLGALIAIMCIGLGISSFFNAKNALISNVTVTLPEIAKTGSNEINTAVKGQIGRIESIAARTDISDPKISIADKQNVLKDEAKRLGSVNIEFVDLDGKIKKPDGQVIDVSTTPYMAQALKGTSCVSDPIIIDENKTMMVFFAVPVKNDNKVVGVLLESRDANALSKYTNKIKIGKTGTAFLINGEGTTIAHENKDKVLKQENVKIGRASCRERV